MIDEETELSALMLALKAARRSAGDSHRFSRLRVRSDYPYNVSTILSIDATIPLMNTSFDLSTDKGSAQSKAS